MIKISFWGDCKIDDVNQIGLCTEITDLLKDATINVINFEAPVINLGIPINKTGPTLSQSEETPGWLETNGFNVISLANNHIMDYGIEGYMRTIELFKNSILLGAGNWEEAYKIKVVEVDNVKIGFLALTHCEFGTLTDKYDLENNTGAAWICHPDIPSIIEKGKRDVDYLFVIAHAGIEYFDLPLPEWRNLYKSFIDHGADAVVGSHPHVVQGWEVYKGSPIFYSLGNFCFQKSNQMAVRPGWNDSLCVVFTIDQNSASDIYFEVLNIHFDSSRLLVRHDVKLQMFISGLNQILLEDKVYIERVNQHCAELLSHYQIRFSLSGYHFFPSFNWSLLKTILGVLLRRKESKPVHIINNLRCESHRWAILRAILFNTRAGQPVF